MTSTSPHVGTLREKPLHASLKQWCFEEGDRLEVPVDGFVVDVVRDDLLIEVQTRGFSSMKKKLTTLLGSGHPVRIVHPIAVDRWIVRLDADGAILGRRRSPKHGSVLDLFAELVSFPSLIEEPGLEIHVVLTEEDEYRIHDPTKAWRRRGWVVQERRLISVVDVVEIRDRSDLIAVLPEQLEKTFTTADIASAAACPRRVAQQMAYCLKHSGAIHQVGKRGNAIEYALV